MPKLTLATDILAAALVGFEAQKSHIDAQIAEIRRALGGDSRARKSPTATAGRPRKKRSAAVRRRMALAQQARWAAIKKTAPSGEAANTEKPKRTVSAAARRKMALAQKRRWAAVKKASKPVAVKTPAA
jgi:hypothetical protein